jgi:anti-sigma factor RsiW
VKDCNRNWRELALVFDLLEGDEKRRFDVHIASCGECFSIVERLKKLEGTLRGLKGALHGAHPSPEDIYDYAAGPGAEAFEEGERVAALEAHLRRCPACVREVDRIRTLDRTASPIREVLRGDAASDDAPPAPVPSIAELMRTVERRVAETPSDGTVLRTPLRPRWPRRPKALLPALAAAASIALAVVLLLEARGTRGDHWIVASPNTHARRITSEGTLPLRAGESIPGDVRIENPGPEDLILLDASEGRLPRLSVVGPGSRATPRSARPGDPLPDGGTLVAVLTSPPLRTVRGMPERSALIAPRLTVRERKPSFLFSPGAERGRYRVVCLRRHLTTGERTPLLTTPEGEGPLIPYPADAPALDYDSDHAFEWRLEKLEGGAVEAVGPVDFYLDPDPEPKLRAAEALRERTRSSPAAGHFLAANHYLRAELYVDAMRELLASDPSLTDPGVRELFESIARSLEVDVQAARTLLAPPPR